MLAAANCTMTEKLMVQRLTFSPGDETRLSLDRKYNVVFKTFEQMMNSLVIRQLFGHRLIPKGMLGTCSAADALRRDVNEDETTFPETTLEPCSSSSFIRIAIEERPQSLMLPSAGPKSICM